MLRLLCEQSPPTTCRIRDSREEQGRDPAHMSVITTLQKMLDRQQLA